MSNDSSPYIKYYGDLTSWQLHEPFEMDEFLFNGTVYQIGTKVLVKYFWKSFLYQLCSKLKWFVDTQIIYFNTGLQIKFSWLVIFIRNDFKEGLCTRQCIVLTSRVYFQDVTESWWQFLVNILNEAKNWIRAKTMKMEK